MSSEMSSRFTTMKLRSSATAATHAEVLSDAEALKGAAPFIKDRLYFATRRRKPASTPIVHYFSVDDVYVYLSYNEDFGPHNLAVLTKYCKKMNRKLKVRRRVGGEHEGSP